MPLQCKMKKGEAIPQLNRKRENGDIPKSLKEIYQECGSEIFDRLDEFRSLLERGDEESLFAEMVFCIFTPQSNARSCWEAVERLCSKNLLLKGDAPLVARHLKGVRFHHTKARRAVQARKRFSLFLLQLRKTTHAQDLRQWLVKNIPGLGYKEASHFLRNIGFGEDLAILDRHIMRNLREFGIIPVIPSSISRKTYLEMEEKMKRWAEQIHIPLSHLDLVLWFREKKEIFK